MLLLNDRGRRETRSHQSRWKLMKSSVTLDSPIRRRIILGGLGAGLPPPMFAAGGTRELRIIGPWEINSLDPATSGYFFCRTQVCETLVDAHDDGRLRPGLAKSWDVDVDGVNWRFTLREGAEFHDGAHVNAIAVAEALQRAQKRPGLLRHAPITSISARSGDVVIRLNKPFALLPALLAHSSTMILAPSSFNAQGGVDRIVGSGPYRVIRLDAPHGFTVEAIRPELALRRARYDAVGRSETRALMAETGQSQLAFALDAASIQRLRRVASTRILQVLVPRTMIVKVNCGHRWLLDTRVRQALSMAIDRRGIALGLLRDETLAATQLFPPTLSDWHRRDIAPLRYDPAAAKSLLRESGWVPNRDGMLARKGERFIVSLRTFPDRPELPIVAAAIQEQFRQVGIHCSVAIGNSGDIPLRHKDGTLELALAARHYALSPDPLGTLMQDFAPQGGDWGAMNWRSNALDAAISALSASSVGNTNTVSLRSQIVSTLQAELPVIPVAWYRQTAAVSPALSSLSLDPLERNWRLTDMPALKEGAI